MDIIILPGYSPRNKIWAEEVALNLKKSINGPISVYNWRHWAQGSFSLKYELTNLKKEISDRKVNLLAKSVGTQVAMYLLLVIPHQINKIILCGIPTKNDVQSIDLGQEEIDNKKGLYRKALGNINPKKVLCIQNKGDPLAKYSEVSRFIKRINPKIEILEKPGETHEYPYWLDFQGFLVES